MLKACIVRNNSETLFNSIGSNGCQMVVLSNERVSFAIDVLHPYGYSIILL